MELLKFIQILLCVVLFYISADTVNGGRVLTDPEFEGCIRPDESGEPKRDHRQRRTRAPAFKATKTGNVDGKESQPKKKFDKAKEPKWEIHENNMKFKAPQIDTGFHSSERVSAKELEEAIEHTDRETLLEWYDYGYSLKELLNLVDDGARQCGCEPLGPPILDTQKRINHALNSVSNKLRYGTVSMPKDYGSSEKSESTDSSE